MSGKEKQFEEKLKKFLTDRGHWQVKFFANSYTRAGVPDILACICGRFVGIEVKAENGRASELQLYNRRKIREAGGICIIVYPSQMELFKRLILQIETGNYQNYMQYEFDK
jgi:hypothetical protein